VRVWLTGDIKKLNGIIKERERERERQGIERRKDERGWMRVRDRKRSHINECLSTRYYPHLPPRAIMATDRCRMIENYNVTSVSALKTRRWQEDEPRILGGWSRTQISLLSGQAQVWLSCKFTLRCKWIQRERHWRERIKIRSKRKRFIISPRGRMRRLLWESPSVDLLFLRAGMCVCVCVCFSTRLRRTQSARLI